MRLVALRKIDLPNETIEPGQEFQIPEKEGNILKAVRMAADPGAEVMTTENSAALVPPRRKYQRRDMTPEK